MIVGASGRVGNEAVDVDSGGRALTVAEKLTVEASVGMFISFFFFLTLTLMGGVYAWRKIANTCSKKSGSPAWAR